MQKSGTTFFCFSIAVCLVSFAQVGLADSVIEDYLNAQGNPWSFSHGVALASWSGNREENLKILRHFMSEAKSGEDLCRVFVVATYMRVNPKALPPPNRDALRDYFGKYLFYRFKPIAFWPHYPDDWSVGMRNVLKIAIQEGYVEHNFLHAVCFIPLFFNGKQAAETYSLDTLNKALDYRSDFASRVEKTDSYNRGIASLVSSCWKYASAERREEMFEDLFIERIRTGRKGRNLNEYVQLEFWFNKNPDLLQKYLKKENRSIRQYVLWVAAQGDSQLDYSDPIIFREMIEGLKNDSIGFNDSIFPKLLLKHAKDTEPELRKALKASKNPQQKKILQEILKNIDAEKKPEVANKKEPDNKVQLPSP